MLLLILELGFSVMLLSFLFSQVFLPLLLGTALFPLFRRRQGALEAKLTEVNQFQLEREMEKEIKRVRGKK